MREAAVGISSDAKQSGTAVTHFGFGASLRKLLEWILTLIKPTLSRSTNTTLP